MAYYLGIKKKDDYKLLDISLLEEFNRLSKFSGPACQLYEIDTFTTKYEDEVSLKKALWERGILSTEDILKEISIRRKNNQKLEKVRYGLVYKEQVRFLNIQYLRYILLSRQDDFTFLERLISYYRNSFVNKANIDALSMMVRNRVNLQIDIILNDFYSREIYRFNNSKKEYELNYKAFHDLAMFVYNYIKNERNNSFGITSSMESSERKQKLLSLKEELLNIDGEKRKIKKKTLQNLDGQTSFFD